MARECEWAEQKLSILSLSNTLPDLKAHRKKESKKVDFYQVSHSFGDFISSWKRLDLPKFLKKVNKAKIKRWYLRVILINVYNKVLKNFRLRAALEKYWGKLEATELEHVTEQRTWVMRSESWSTALPRHIDRRQRDTYTCDIIRNILHVTTLK